jgi:hypothetical protein
MQTQKNNFYLRTNAKGEQCLNVFDFWSSSVENFIRENSVDYLYLSSGEWTNLAFLENVKDYIKKFRIYTQSDDENLDGLSNLSNLISLSLEVISKTPVDFSSFSQLQECYLYWNKNFSDNLFDNNSIKDLSIINWKSSEFQPFCQLNNLISLDIAQSGLDRLEGISKLHQLEVLMLQDLRKLVEASEISNLKKLTDLRLGNCKKITNLDFISSLTSLKTLELYSMGTIPSLDFLKDLTNLESLNFEGSTIIEDGNLNILKSLPNLKLTIFKYRKHYTHKAIEINTLLSHKKD